MLPRLSHRGEPIGAACVFGHPIGSPIGNVMSDDVALVERLNSASKHNSIVRSIVRTLGVTAPAPE